jgi:DNA repair ATPase RecN
MVKVLNELDKKTEDAIQHLAAEFDLANKLISMEEQVKADTDADRLDEAVHDTEAMIRFCNRLGYENRKVHRSESGVKDLLKDLATLLDNQEREEIERFFQQLDIADKKLVHLASRYRGDVRDDVKELIAAEKKLDVAENAEKLKGHVEQFRKSVKQEITELAHGLKELRKWISTNTTLMKSIGDVVGSLKKRAA